MKKLFVALTALGLGFGLAGTAMAGASTTQSVSYEVTAINELAVSGTPSLTINTATAGSDLVAVTDASGSYAITTNESGKKITASIGTDMPANTALKVTLAAPTGATSSGQLTLTSTAQDAVTGISTLAESGKTITYELSASVTAGVVASASKTVTYTITDGV